MIARLYESVVTQHYRDNRQMLFLMGPRQVGKTTTARQAGERFEECFYLNWDNQDDRQTIVGGPNKVAKQVRLETLRSDPPLVIFDEIHKYGRWKGFLKGFFDSWGEDTAVLVTGSSRLDIFVKGGDSLMGRYFGYRLHPLSLAELADQTCPTQPLRKPILLGDEDFQTLLEFGGFPEPFTRQERRFSNRWRRTRAQQLFKEDLRDLTRIQ
ncbi:MAG: AAA family ATPase, partial [Proteobacteria bacterium]|nr:AAA family ATPase [Pseudomonadota bacterium]